MPARASRRERILPIVVKDADGWPAQLGEVRRPEARRVAGEPVGLPGGVTQR